MTRLALLALALLTLPLPADAGRHRSHAAHDAFRREHACPATGEFRGRCPGWVIDHVRALCVGGADAPGNMAWQDVAAAKAKDRWECRR